MVWMVYAGTYLTANLIGTAYEEKEPQGRWIKFIGTTAANMGICIYKVGRYESLAVLVAYVSISYCRAFLCSIGDSEYRGVIAAAPRTTMFSNERTY